MTRYLFLFLIAIVSFNLRAADLIQQADSAYTADEFEKAIGLYSEALTSEGTSAELFYNMGNCYYRLGKYGKAILMYERALRLDPTFTDARENLAFVNSKIVDRPGERGTVLGNALDSMANKARSDIWAWVAFFFFVLTITGICLYIFTTSIPLRKTGFFGALICILLCGSAIFFAFRTAAISEADDVAVVLSPSTILSTAPRTPSDRSLEAMLLHEGTKVTIIDSVLNHADSVPSLWLDVNVDNTHRAWINAADVERI